MVSEHTTDRPDPLYFLLFCVCLFLQGALHNINMANTVASYDQLAHQVEALRKENSHLRRELEDNSNHLSKLETETTGVKVSC